MKLGKREDQIEGKTYKEESLSPVEKDESRANKKQDWISDMERRRYGKQWKRKIILDKNED